MQTITFIGNGQMAFSIAEGLKHKYHIEVVGRSMEKLDAFEKRLGIRIDKAILEHFDIGDKRVVLCVKPNALESTARHLKGKAELLVSVLAGTPIEKLSKTIKSKAYIRAMPNIAASVGASMTTLTGDISHKEEAEVLLRGAGEVLWLESEKALDIATALAGSGPAYLAIMAEALAEGAVVQGLKRDEALTLTRGLFDGFAKLFATKHPVEIKEAVMSPGGTTAAGCAALEAHGLRHASISAIREALARAKILAKES